MKKAKRKFSEKMWAVLRDGKPYIARLTRESARGYRDLYNMDGHSKHKWRIVRVTISGEA